MGLPLGAVRNALQRDGKDPGIMDLDPEKSLKSQTGAQEELQDTGVPLKEDPEYSKVSKSVLSQSTFNPFHLLRSNFSLSVLQNVKNGASIRRCKECSAKRR